MFHWCSLNLRISQKIERPQTTAVKNEIDEIGPLQAVGMRMKDEEPFS
jgi:hypothetical protein